MHLDDAAAAHLANVTDCDCKSNENMIDAE